MAVIFQFQEWKVFDLIPDTGKISYVDLAKALDAEEALISKWWTHSIYHPRYSRRQILTLPRTVLRYACRIRAPCLRRS